jgi:hypothetical protein
MVKVYRHEPALVEDFTNERYATSGISLGAEGAEGVDLAGESYDGKKFTIVIKKITVPETTEQLSELLRERWNLDVVGMLDVFYTAAFTRPNYKQAAKAAIEKEDWDEAHRLAQQEIDEFRFNTKRARTAVTKAEVQELKGLKALAAKLGLSMEQLIENAANL